MERGGGPDLKRFLETQAGNQHPESRTALRSCVV